MTIIIEREAILSAVGSTTGASHSPLPSSSCRSPSSTLSVTHQHDDAYSPSSQSKDIRPSLANAWYGELLRHHRVPTCYQPQDETLPDLDDTDDDCTTISSCSSGARSRTFTRPTVSFAELLVSEVRTRPRTRPEDVAALFYSCEETQRFRQEYRHERRVVQDEDTPSSSAGTKSKSLSSTDNQSKLDTPDESPSTAGHRISRVVVLHEDTLETFIDKDLALIQASLSSSGGGDLTTADDAFFDNDRFWSGQITWY